MTEGLLVWGPCLPSLHLPNFRPSIPMYNYPKPNTLSVSATLESVESEQQLTAKERRKLRNERRESNATDWREEVENKLLLKPKKKHVPWNEALNLDKLADMGPQWWVVSVARTTAQAVSELLAETLIKHYPDFEFKVYVPTVSVKRKLKNGSISVKPKYLFPGRIFLRCVLNKEMHDFIREYDGVHGFVGFMVGNTKRQINRPKPLSVTEIETMFQQVKEEQEKTDQAFAEETKREAAINTEQVNGNSLPNGTIPVVPPKTKKRVRKGKDPLGSSPLGGSVVNLPIPGSSVRVLSGPFTDFKGNVKKLHRKTGKATVGFMLFGKENCVEFDLDQIASET